MITSSATTKVGPTTSEYVTPTPSTSTLATMASATTKTAATTGGRVRRRRHARSIIAAAKRQAASSAIKPTTSRLTSATGWGSGARRSPRNDLVSCHGDRLRPQSSLCADVDLVELLLGEAVRSHELAEIGADDRKQESNRDADDADVL